MGSGLVSQQFMFVYKKNKDQDELNFYGSNCTISFYSKMKHTSVLSKCVYVTIFVILLII
jgi:hypothetical protein